MTMRELNPYLLADNIRRENENYFAWLQGFYFYNAVSVAMRQSLNGDNNAKYFQEPIRITPYTEEEELEMKYQAQKDAIAYFENLRKSYKGKKDGRD